MTDVLFVCFSALVLVAFFFPSPLWVHAIHVNSAPLALTVWVFVLVLIGFVNALVWSGDDDERALGWCGFTQAFKIAAPTALASCHFILCVFIVRVLRTEKASLDARDRRIHRIYDCLLAFFLPISVMVLHLAYQPSRFAIARTIGCQPTLALVPAAFFLGLLHGPVISLFGLVASAYVAWCIIRYRKHIDRLARPCDAFYSALWFLRLSILVIVLGPVCFVCSLIICLQQFRQAGPYSSHLVADRTRIIHYPDVNRAGALEIFPLLVGIITILLLGPGAETAAVASRFGDVLGVRRVFKTAKRRWSEHHRRSELWGSPERSSYDDDLEEYIQPDAVIRDVDTLRPLTQTSEAPTIVRASHITAASRALSGLPGAPQPPPPSLSSFASKGPHRLERPSTSRSAAPSAAMAGLKPFATSRRSEPRITFAPHPR